MRKLKYQSNNKGFTFIEVMITIGIILALAAGVTIMVTKSRVSTNQSKCTANLKNIAVGLQAYYTEKETFPEDGYPFDGNDLNPLSTELANYVSDESLFICPEDKDQTSTSNFASYDPYYVERMGSNQEDDLVIGCPRHKEAKKASSLFYSNFTKTTNIGNVLANGQEIPPDGTTAQRTISNTGDVMTFADGSTVTVTDTQAGYGTFLVQSFQLADGTLYSVIRVENDGEIDVQVSSGSKFEIITPSAIVGVRGTRFNVETINFGYTTIVTLINGTVYMKNRATGKTTTLTGGGITDFTVVVELPSPFIDTTTEGEEPPSSVDTQLTDLINDTSMNSGDLKSALEDASPISASVLNIMIDRNPPMNSSDIKSVLNNESPIPASVLMNTCNSGVMNSSDNKDVFIQNSPLPASVLNLIIAGSPPMDPSDLQSVLDAQ